jgi:polyisoprenoid-binding protein YceI
MKLSSIALTFGLAAISSISCAQSATYMIEPTHTYVTWEAKHFGTSTSRGRFDKKAGSITLDKTAKTGSVDVAIQTDSINTGFAAFDKHLQSEETFLLPRNFHKPNSWEVLSNLMATK